MIAEIYDYKYIVVLLNLIYLIAIGLFDVMLLLKLATAIKVKNKNPNVSSHRTVYIKPSHAKVILFISTFFLLFLFFYKRFLFAVLLPGGSDAITYINEEKKIDVWFFYGILHIMYYLILVSFFLCKVPFLKILFALLATILSVMSGKKSGIISFISAMFLFYLIFSYGSEKLVSLKKLAIKKSMVLKVVLGILFIYASICFAHFQFLKTTNEIEDSSLVMNILPNFLKLVYSSSTAYLEQLIVYGGYQYAFEYSDKLGLFGLVKYFFNPFTKFVFGEGIEKGIGPYLCSTLFGYLTPHGVNPTLLFELFFIFGDIVMGFIASLILLVLIFYVQNVALFNLIKRNDNAYYLAFSYGILTSTFAFRNDTLNTIRGIPFLIVLLGVYFISKTLRKRRILSNV